MSGSGSVTRQLLNFVWTHWQDQLEVRVTCYHLQDSPFLLMNICSVCGMFKIVYDILGRQVCILMCFNFFLAQQCSSLKQFFWFQIVRLNSRITFENCIKIHMLASTYGKYTSQMWIEILAWHICMHVCVNDVYVIYFFLLQTTHQGIHFFCPC